MRSPEGAASRGVNNKAAISKLVQVAGLAIPANH
jgi:hypothetical protein